MLDIESCDRCAGCPGYGVNRSRPLARGGGGDRRALGRGPGKDGGTTKTDAAGARELTGIADLTGGKDHPTARLSGPGAGKVWHRVQELAGRARKRLARRVPIATLDPPSKGQQERHRLGLLQGHNQRAAPFTSSSSPATPQVRYAALSSRTNSPKADSWPLVSLSAYQRVLSPKSLAWAGPYANGRTPTWPTSTQAQPATRRTAPKPSTDIIELGRRTARGYRNPTNYQLPAPNAPHHRRPRCLHPHSTLKSQQSQLTTSALPHQL